LFLGAESIEESRRWEEGGYAGSIHEKVKLSSNPSEHPRVQNIRMILDSSDL
jgi:hypothetical protein